MSGQGWLSLLNDQWQIGAGTALSASASTATISPQNSSAKDYLISPYEWRVNKTLMVYADGILGSGGTASNLTVFLAAGATPTTLSTSPAMALGTGSLSSLPWHLWARIRCLSVASSGNTLETKGTFIFNNATAPALGTANGVVCDHHARDAERGVRQHHLSFVHRRVAELSRMWRCTRSRSHRPRCQSARAISARRTSTTMTLTYR